MGLKPNWEKQAVTTAKNSSRSGNSSTKRSTLTKFSLMCLPVQPKPKRVMFYEYLYIRTNIICLNKVMNISCH